jgi:GNAT superfamily N-acetyltransferase
MRKTIRAARPDDAAILSRIAKAAYAKYTPPMVKAPAPVFYDYAQVIAAARTWVLEVGGEACGMVTLEAKPDHLLLRNLAILPEKQGQGLGRLALVFAEGEARRLSKPRIRLWTNVHMPDNVPYYQSAGFTETHREHVDDYSFIHMIKTVEINASAARAQS